MEQWMQEANKQVKASDSTNRPTARIRDCTLKSIQHCNTDSAYLMSIHAAQYSDPCYLKAHLFVGTAL